MASKTDVTARKDAKAARPKPKGKCGHEVVRVQVSKVKGRTHMRWYCEQDGLV